MEFEKVLVPVNGEDWDEQALQLATSVTKEGKGKIYILYVIEVRRNLSLDASVEHEAARSEEVLQRLEALAEDSHRIIQAEILKARESGPAVVHEAVEREVDAIVMAAPYKRRYGSFHMGTTVPYILKNAPCPVLLLQAGSPNSS